MLFSGFMMLMGVSVLNVGFVIILGEYVNIFNVSNTQISILTAITHLASALTGELPVGAVFPQCWPGIYDAFRTSRHTAPRHRHHKLQSVI